MGHYDCKHCGEYGCFGSCPEGQAEKARLEKIRKVGEAVNVKIALNALNEQRDGDGDICVEDLDDDFKLIEEGDWNQDHKYQRSTSIVQHNKTKTFWSITRSRSGSPFSDWYYGEAYVTRVTPVVRTIQVTSWEEVK
ncbi:hypothetical protein VP3_0024 [Vibrio phage VP3]|uniref:Nucleotide reductase subunit C n=2 Tax=Chatterjeevirus VP4 TaxID=2733614 RepID=Q4TVX6_9CAUD|nr:ribonucleotide reductase [Vibrio phage VP4]AAY46281.1 nucleotide reductase subunit C [Vibrio phage VP4]AFH14424.1 hypothetical protein VP3_0024 [Vibrio phage VP3]